MSLKAKIEAVIYASEEPVTLAQLTGLLGEEGQAELDALESQQQSLALDEGSANDPDALNAETLMEPGDPIEETTEEPAAEADTPAEASEPASADETEPVAEGQPAAENEPSVEIEPTAETESS